MRLILRVGLLRKYFSKIASLRVEIRAHGFDRVLTNPCTRLFNVLILM